MLTKYHLEVLSWKALKGLSALVFNLISFLKLVQDNPLFEHFSIRWIKKVLFASYCGDVAECRCRVWKLNVDAEGGCRVFQVTMYCIASNQQWWTASARNRRINRLPGPRCPTDSVGDPVHRRSRNGRQRDAFAIGSIWRATRAAICLNTLLSGEIGQIY